MCIRIGFERETWILIEVWACVHTWWTWTGTSLCGMSALHYVCHGEFGCLGYVFSSVSHRDVRWQRPKRLWLRGGGTETQNLHRWSRKPSHHGCFCVLERNLIQTQCGRGTIEFISVELLSKINLQHGCQVHLCASAENSEHIFSVWGLCTACRIQKPNIPLQKPQQNVCIQHWRKATKSPGHVTAQTDPLLCLPALLRHRFPTPPLLLLLHNAVFYGFHPCLRPPFPPVHLLIYQPTLWLTYYCNVNAGKHPSTGRSASGDWARN